MQELVDSMVRFSTALTLFGLQQITNTISLASDSEAAKKKIEENLDNVTQTLTQQLDSHRRPMVDSVSNLVDKTREALDVPALNVRKIVDNATDVIRETTDTLSNAISKSSLKKTDEPIQASTILTDV